MLADGGDHDDHPSSSKNPSGSSDPGGSGGGGGPGGPKGPKEPFPQSDQSQQDKWDEQQRRARERRRLIYDINVKKETFYLRATHLDNFLDGGNYYTPNTPSLLRDAFDEGHRDLKDAYIEQYNTSKFRGAKAHLDKNLTEMQSVSDKLTDKQNRNWNAANPDSEV